MMRLYGYEKKRKRSVFYINNSIRKSLGVYLIRCYKIDINWLRYATFFLKLICIPEKSQKHVKFTIFPLKLSFTLRLCSIFFFTKQQNKDTCRCTCDVQLQSKKKRTQKYRIFSRLYNFSNASVSICTRISLLGIKILDLHFSAKKLRYTNTAMA